MTVFNLNIGVCGTISSGKSTLVNALLGNIVSGVGMSKTTTSIIKYNYKSMISMQNDIIIPPNVSVNLYDTPGFTDIYDRFHQLANCHIVICVIDFIDSVNPTSQSLVNILNSLKLVSQKSTLHQRFIYTVNKGDIYSSEYANLFKYINKIISSHGPIGVTYSINASIACLKNLKDPSSCCSEYLARIVNSVLHKTNHTMFAGLVQDEGYSKLIQTINRIILENIHLMCMSNSITKYKKLSYPTTSHVLAHYDELKNICASLGYEYKTEYGAHLIVTTSSCSVM